MKSGLLASLLLAVFSSPAARAQTPPQKKTTAPINHWRVSAKKNEMDGIVTTTLIVDSSNYGGSGGLIIRCGGGKAEIYICLDDYAQPELGGGHTVRLKFDSSSPIEDGATASTDSKGLFTYYPLQLLRRLKKTRTFLFEFTPYEKEKKIFSFNVSGLSAVLTPEREKSCGQLSDDADDPYRDPTSMTSEATQEEVEDIRLSFGDGAIVIHPQFREQKPELALENQTSSAWKTIQLGLNIDGLCKGEHRHWTASVSTSLEWANDHPLVKVVPLEANGCKVESIRAIVLSAVSSPK